MSEYLKLQANADIHIGDIVRVMRKPKSDDLPWGVGWPPEMDEHVGRDFEVNKIDGISGICCTNRYWYPFYVLSIIKRGGE